MSISMAKINACPREVPLPRKSPRMNRLPCLLRSPKSPNMLPERHVLRVQHQHRLSCLKPPVLSCLDESLCSRVRIVYRWLVA
eukprot:6095311-Prymnesium_polylepis.1